MPKPADYEYPSPMDGWRHLPPLPDDKTADGKSYVNPASTGLSAAYTRFPAPIANLSEPDSASDSSSSIGRSNSFDIHIYYDASDAWQTTYATELWQRIRHEFPELRIYRLWDRPVGPHPLAMFEVNVFTPAQFGAFVGWLVIWRGPLSVLVHANTGDAKRDHGQRASWLGTPVHIDLGIFDAIEEMKRKRIVEAETAGQAAND